MKRYVRIYKQLVRINLMKDFAYRGAFWIKSLLTAVESIVTLLTINILFIHLSDIAGWSYHDMLVLIGIFMLTQTFAWLTYKAALSELDTIINKGDLDWILVKPVDTQFLASTRRIDFDDAARSVVGLIIIGVGLRESPLFETALRVPLFITVFLLGQIVLYAIILIIKTISFKSIQGWATNAISWRFHDLAHFPTDIYRGFIRMLYTFVFPLVFVATVPAKALTGRFEWYMLAGAAAAAAISFMAARLIWNMALRTYSSASS